MSDADAPAAKEARVSKSSLLEEQTAAAQKHGLSPQFEEDARRLDAQHGVAPLESVEDLQAAVAEMRDYFDTGATLPADFRIAQLDRLHAWLRANEDDVLAALQADLGKAPFESYACELGLV